MNDPLIDSEIRRLNQERKARLEKRAKALAAQEEQERKSREYAERERADRQVKYSPPSPVDYSAFEREQQARIKQRDDEKRISNMVAVKERFFRPETSPYDRGVLLATYALDYNKVNGTRLSSSDILEMWQEERKAATMKKIRDILSG